MNDGPGPGAWAAGIAAVLVVGFLGIAAIGWLFSINGVDSGEVCVVREGGPFDGRNIKEVRQPGSGPKPIGAWNHQDCLPVTERDSNDVIEGEQAFPTRDSVQVIVDGQAIYQLTTDPGLVEEFYRKYGRRKWDGKELWDDEGWLNFQRQRVAPVILDAQREVISEYGCLELNNLCLYVQNPEEAVRRTGEAEAEGDNTQNLSAAQRALGEKIKAKMEAAFGGVYFENVRYQNLRIRFEPEVLGEVTKAQSLRTQAVNAELDAERKVQLARGERRVAREQARAYRANPVQAQIDRIRAFCGNDGCDPQVFGGGAGDVIANLGRTGG